MPLRPATVRVGRPPPGDRAAGRRRCNGAACARCIRSSLRISLEPTPYVADLTLCVLLLPLCVQPLRRELDGDDVAVAHHVVATLEAQRPAVARAAVAAGIEQLLPADDFGADEALLDVGVDLTAGVPGGETVAQVPGLRGLALAGGEERDQVQQLEGAAHDALQARLADAELGAHRGCVLVL